MTKKSKLLVRVKADLENEVDAFLQNRWKEIMEIEDALSINDHAAVSECASVMIQSGTEFGFGFISDYGKQIAQANHKKDKRTIIRILGRLKKKFDVLEVEIEEDQEYRAL